jgi:hypothetical protein
VSDRPTPPAPEFGGSGRAEILVVPESTFKRPESGRANRHRGADVAGQLPNVGVV